VAESVKIKCPYCKALVVIPKDDVFAGNDHSREKPIEAVAERAAIVAHLRSRPIALAGIMADEIEKGEHHG
jgi:hypothetical protein